MSGHSKWSTIKHKKGAADAKRGKLFSRLSKEITLAARAGGGDVTMNARLRSAIAAAKSANMPSDNVDRAIKKGTGELGGGVIEELSYEGYAPGGVAVMVNCLSDNRNRTAADVRSMFTRHNSSLAGTGAVAWMFQRKARFDIEWTDGDDEKLLELLFDAGVEVDDVTVAEEAAEIIAPADLFADTLEVLEQAKIAISESGLTMVPENYMRIEETGIARQVLRLVEALEEIDDVQEVFTNLDMSDSVMEALSKE